MSVKINTEFNDETGLNEWHPIVKSNEMALAEAINTEEQARAAADDALKKACEDHIIDAEHIAAGAVLGKHYWQPLPAGADLNDTRGNGFFYFNDSTLLHCPCTRGVFIPLHYNQEGKTLERAQIVIDTQNSKIYLRWAKQSTTYAIFDDWNDVTEIPPASIDVLGGIKPLASGSTNRSGLVIGEDGTTYVNTKTERGITRDGAGQIGINPATDEEVKAGTETHKPVVPATLMKFFQNNFKGFEVNDIDHTISLYGSCTASDIDSTYEAGIYSYTGDFSSKSDPVKYSGVLIVRRADSSVSQFKLSITAEGEPEIHSRSCGISSSGYERWQEWGDARHNIFLPTTITHATIDDVTESGIYCFNGYSDTAPLNQNGLLAVYATPDGSYQLLLGTKSIYCRARDGSWSEWTQVGSKGLEEKLEAKFVDSLPTSSVEGVPVSIERCSVSAGDDGYTLTSGSNAANKYGLAHIDFTENAVDATSIIIEMDTQIPGGRWLVGLVDLSQRPGESYRTTYDKTGVIFTHGTKDGNYYYVNDVNKWNTTFKDNWFHVRTVVNFADKTVQYEITDRETGAAVLSGTESFIDEGVTTVTGIEFYTWLNDSSMEIDNVNITVNHDVSENVLYILNGSSEMYIYKNGVPVCLSSDLATEWGTKLDELSKNIIASGNRGDNIKWILYTSGLLDISGIGEIQNGTAQSYPWNEYKDQIKEVKIHNGITNIGDDAFANCSNLLSVDIPTSVNRIGSGAFWDCTGLKSVNIPKGVSVIEEGVFYGCSNLKYINMPNSVTTIEANAFGECNALSIVYYPFASSKSDINHTIADDNEPFYLTANHYGELYLQEYDCAVKTA